MTLSLSRVIFVVGIAFLGFPVLLDAMPCCNTYDCAYDCGGISNILVQSNYCSTTLTCSVATGDMFCVCKAPR